MTRLGLPPTLLKTFKSTNPIESMISVGLTVTRNVKRWRDGQMVLRWTAAGMLEAASSFVECGATVSCPCSSEPLQRHEEVITQSRAVA